MVSPICCALDKPTFINGIAILTSPQKPLKRSSLQPPWSTTLYFFLCMGGFVVQTDTGPPKRFDPADLVDMINDGTVETPMVSDADINDHSKASWLTKSLALLQVIWFVTQLLARAIERLPVTTLELFTMSIIVCALATYAFY